MCALAVIIAAFIGASECRAQAPDASPAAAAAEAAATPAEATPVSFRVVIDAPRAYRKAFEDALEITRWERGERVTVPLLERLAAEARAEVTDALAADGYFSPRV